MIDFGIYVHNFADFGLKVSDFFFFFFFGFDTMASTIAADDFSKFTDVFLELVFRLAIKGTIALTRLDVEDEADLTGVIGIEAGAS